MLGWRFWSSLFTAQTRGAAALHCLKSCQFYILLGGIGLLSGTRQARRVQQLLLICSEMTSSKQTTGVAYLRPSLGVLLFHVSCVQVVDYYLLPVFNVYEGSFQPLMIPMNDAAGLLEH